MPRRALWGRAIRQIVPRFDAVLAEGPVMREAVIDLGFPQDRVHLVPIAASLAGIVYRDPTPPNGGVRMLLCGRMVEKKGHALALEAFAALIRELPYGSRLVFVGTGPLEASLRTRSDQLGVQSQVDFLGPRLRSEYLAILGNADLLLAPSRTAANGDSEGGAPTTILDAQATGVITVASRHADIPFLVSDDETGYLADEGDALSLSSAIRRALASTRDWSSIAQRARRQVDARHSDMHVAKLLAAIHDSVADR
jgi:glycosyltransferase involved in cell wall biosynthesis